jgi:uncharacterized protein (DUF58 family)
MHNRRLFFAIFLVFAFVLSLASGFYATSRLFSVLVVALALSWGWAKLSLRGVSAGAEEQTTLARVGDWVEERVWLRNDSALPRPWVHLQDLGDVPGLPSQVAGLTAKGYRSWVLRARSTRRGRFTWGPLRISSGDPLGLFRTERVIPVRDSLVVYPAPVPLKEFVLSASEEAGDAPEYRGTSQITPNVVSVRRYVVGDSLNRIHWKSSAKLNRLMVKEFETEVQTDLWLLLDLNEASQIGEGEEGTEEMGVTVAASIAQYLLGYDNGVGFLAMGDREYVVPTGSGEKHLWRMLEALALCKAEGTRPLRDVLAVQAPRFTKRMGIIAVTPSVQDALAVGSFLVERNAPGAVILLEPMSFGARESALPALGNLLATGIAVYIVRRGDDLARALSFAALGSVASRPGGRRGFMTPERWGR